MCRNFRVLVLMWTCWLLRSCQSSQMSDMRAKRVFLAAIFCSCISLSRLLKIRSVNNRLYVLFSGRLELALNFHILINLWRFRITVPRKRHFVTPRALTCDFSHFYSKRWRTSRRFTWSAVNSLTAWPPSRLSTPTRKSHQAPHDPSRVRTQKHSQIYNAFVFLNNYHTQIWGFWGKSMLYTCHKL